MTLIAIDLDPQDKTAMRSARLAAQRAASFHRTEAHQGQTIDGRSITDDRAADLGRMADEFDVTYERLGQLLDRMSPPRLDPETAALTVLLLVKSPLWTRAWAKARLNDDEGPGAFDLGRLLTYIAEDERLTEGLSFGERALYRIGLALWNGDEQATIADLGGIDSTTRPTVLHVIVSVWQ